MSTAPGSARRGKRALAPTTTPPLPRIKLNMRSSPVSKPKHTGKRPRSSASAQRHQDEDETESDLTPDEDGDAVMADFTTAVKGKGKAASPVKGRERKRAVKLGQVERQRARDEKFGVGQHTDSDSTSSYGDDESDLEPTAGPSTLPDAFAGQEVEDLAYGAGPVDFGVEEEAEHEWWQDQEEEEEFIAQLSGSDIDGLQSQSSVHSESEVTDSEHSSGTDDAMDEFGFPSIPFPDESPADAAPLILMEQWDGQFVLVQTKQERDRSRTRRAVLENTREASVSASTLSATEATEQALVIDPDAEETTDSSDWSGVEDNGGDTTDSMAEEDMPLLDSPALDELIGQQLAAGLLVDNHAVAAAAAAVAQAGIVAAMAPAIVVTDTDIPSTPGTTAPPVMGTFIPVTDDPSSHAVIDGSRTTTKSPFTRRRHAAPASADRDRKRKSSVSTTATAPTVDPFSPFYLKKARYSSIPGHPRYIAARRAAQQAARAFADPLDRETTPSEEDESAFSLEDMLDSSVLHHVESSEEEGEEDRPFRFDKVPVSMYMRRNILSSTSRPSAPHTVGHPARHTRHSPAAHFSSPIHRGRTALADTLAGPLASRGMLLISPILAPVGNVEHSHVEEVRNGAMASGTGAVGYESGVLSRKEKRKMKQRGGEMAPLQI